MLSASGRAGLHAARLHRGLRALAPQVFAGQADCIHDLYRVQGITFDHHGAEHTFPFDLLPRVITSDELATAIHATVAYVSGLTLVDTLRAAAGARRCVCHDLAPLMIAIGRGDGRPETSTPGEPARQPRRTGQGERGAVGEAATANDGRRISPRPPIPQRTRG